MPNIEMIGFPDTIIIDQVIVLIRDKVPEIKDSVILTVHNRESGTRAFNLLGLIHPYFRVASPNIEDRVRVVKLLKKEFGFRVEWIQLDEVL